MKLPKVIGLSGKMGSGKTTIANLLISRYREYDKLSFGDVLKREAAELYKFPLDWAYSETGKKQIVETSRPPEIQPFLKRIFKRQSAKLPHYNMTVREVLQWHGTDLRRAQNPDYWVHKMAMNLLGNPWILIDDVRFINEAKLVSQFGGVVIRINPHEEWLPGPHAQHPSETELDDFPYFDFKVTQIAGNPKYASQQIIYYINNLNR